MPVRVTKDLTDVSVRNARPTDKQKEIFDRSVGGFALRVSPSGSKTFVVSYRCNGKKRRMTIGNAATLSLADARAAATAIKAKAKNGVDALEERRLEGEQKQQDAKAESLKDKNTFGAVADLYIQRYAKGTGKEPKKKTWKQDYDMLQLHVVPVWGERQISELGRRDVVALLDDIEDGSGVYAANRVLAVVRKLFNWALLERALIEVTPIVPGMARKGEKKRTRSLREDEIRSVWEAAGILGYPFGSFYRLLLATGQRRGEVVNMKWSQIELEDAIWTIPADGTKNGREHVVPLNSVAMEIVNGLHRIDGSDLLFPSRSDVSRPASGFSKAKARCDKLTESNDFAEAGFVVAKDWRVHDLRRTCATSMQEDLSVPLHIIGSVLNHSPAATMGVTSVYATGNMVKDRRKALDAWGERLKEIMSDNQPKGNIVRIRC